ncbi:MAG: flagellar biosynthetic protein FliR, partial [Firmicutes bacterium]|nr:flagellar biosynthetic protein FliR [Bacillota bacterium]
LFLAEKDHQHRPVKPAWYARPWFSWVVVISIVVVILAVLVLPLVPDPAKLPPDLSGWALAALKEVAVGLVMGYVANLVFVAAQVAGGFLDIEVGFGITNIIDPHTGQSLPLVGNFLQLLAFLLFLLTNGHHLLIAALVKSFHVIPVGEAVAGPNARDALVAMFGAMFATGVKLAAPVIGALFLANLALGIISRTVPQLNLFVVGLPVKLGAGLLLMAVVMPMYLGILEGLFGRMFADLSRILSTMSPVR